MYSGGNYQGGSYISQGPLPAPVEAQSIEGASRIRDGITRAEESLSALHETISSLEKRLDTVLEPQPPAPSGVANGANVLPRSGSHVHGRIVILNEGFDGAVSRLRDLMRRIEV